MYLGPTAVNHHMLQLVPLRTRIASLGGCTEPAHKGLTAKHATHEESRQRQFVYRDEMAGFARDLG